MANVNVHGHMVSVDEGSDRAVHYLINLGYEQAEAIFNKAIADSATNFVYEGGGYKLTWTGSGTYSLAKKY